MTPESFYYHANKARKLLDVVGNHYAKQEYGQAHTVLDQILDLMFMCKNQTRSIERFRSMYRHLDMIYTEVSNYTTVSHSMYDFTRDQAIQLRNELLSKGMTLFQVKYEGNGVVDWNTKDEPDYLVALQREYETNWRIKRSETDPYRFYFTVRTGEMTLEGADAMATTIKRLYPTLTPVVYYGTEKKYVVGVSYDTQIKTTTTPENDPNPHDTGN